MNKQEFFSELEECLQGEVSEQEFGDSLSYYKEYFDEQESTGRTEADILEELGSARYIARSIIDARGLDRQELEGRYESRREDVIDDPQDPQPSEMVQRVFSPLLRLGLIIGALILAGLLFSFLLPVILIVVLFLLIYTMFQRW